MKWILFYFIALGTLIGILKWMFKKGWMDLEITFNGLKPHVHKFTYIYDCQKTIFMEQVIIDMEIYARVCTKCGRMWVRRRPWVFWRELDDIEREMLQKRIRQYKGRLVICNPEIFKKPNGSMPPIRFQEKP